MAVDPAVRRLALRTLLAAFAGKSAPEWASGLLTEGLAGHTLFGRNIAEPGQVARLSAELRAVRPDVLLAADEEGGDVTRLGRATGRDRKSTRLNSSHSSPSRMPSSA